MAQRSPSSYQRLTSLTAEEMERYEGRILKCEERTVTVYDITILPPPSPTYSSDQANYALPNASIDTTPNNNANIKANYLSASNSSSPRTSPMIEQKLSSSLTLSLSSSSSFSEIPHGVLSPLGDTKASIPNLDDFRPTPEDFSRDDYKVEEEEGLDVRSRIISTLKNMHFIPTASSAYLSETPPASPRHHDYQAYKSPPPPPQTPQKTLTIALPPPPLLISFTCYETSDVITVTEINPRSKLCGILKVGDVIVGLGNVKYDQRNVEDFVKAIQQLGSNTEDKLMKIYRP